MSIDTDVVVVGGGVAGFAAAIAASQQRKKVLLIDRSASLGGDAVNANVGTICGAYYRSFSGSAKRIEHRFLDSFLETLHAADVNARPFLNNQGLYSIPYEWSLLQGVYEKLLHDNNVDVKLEVTLTAVSIENKAIAKLESYYKGKQLIIRANTVVDCSGNAVVSQLAGIETIKEKSYQAASQIFRVNNISSRSEYALNMALLKTMVNIIPQKNWPESYRALSVVPGSLKQNRVDLKLTLPEIITDTTAADTNFMTETHRRVTEVFLVLKAELKSLERATIEKIFPLPGIRTQQRSKGKYTLTEQDVIGCRKFADAVAIGTWPIEEWKNDGSLSMTYFAADTGYTLPAACLMSSEIDNLFFAGKNISATARAIASARVMGTGLQTGFAAGSIACAQNLEEQQKIIASLHHDLTF